MTKYLSERDIASLAKETVEKGGYKLGEFCSHPIPVDKIAQVLFDAEVDWAPLGRDQGEQTVLGKLRAPAAGRIPEILLNLDVVDSWFSKSEWLSKTVVAHELGHLVLHVPLGQQHQMMFDFGEATVFDVRFSQVQIALGSTIDRTQTLWQEWQANTFARHLLIPEIELRKFANRGDTLMWPTVYELSDEFQVTPSMMRVQLAKMGVNIQGHDGVRSARNMTINL